MGLRQIAVIGSINTDLVLQLDRLPRPGETVLSPSSLRVIGGGKGANQAIAAARLGASVAMVGSVGDDDFGRARIDQLTGEGIDASSIRTVPEMATGVALISVDAAGENAIALGAGANLAVSASQADCPAVANAAVALAVLEIPAAAVTAALAIARANSATTILNAAPPGQLPDSLLRLADYLIVNETEAGALAQCPPPDRRTAPAVAKKLAARTGGSVIITLGSAGLVATDRNEQYHIDAHPISAVDATAAGDAFCGAFATALLDGQCMAAALKFANAAGASACLRLGASSSLPNRDQVLKILAG